MRYLKLYENFEDIDLICQRYKIAGYTINQDGLVDVDGSVYLFHNSLDMLPIKFNKVSGYFDCSYNVLHSLKGSPKEVGNDFRCDSNNLITLSYCPISVGGYFTVGGNQIENLDYFPKEIGGHIRLNSNKLTSLKGCLKIINGNFDCSSNQLESLEDGPTTVRGNKYEFQVNNISDVHGFPEYFTGEILLDKNPVTEIFRIVPSYLYTKFLKWLNEYDVIRGGNKIVGMRLEEAYYMTMKVEFPEYLMKFKNYEII